MVDPGDAAFSISGAAPKLPPVGVTLSSAVVEATAEDVPPPTMAASLASSCVILTGGEQFSSAMDSEEPLPLFLESGVVLFLLTGDRFSSAWISAVQRTNCTSLVGDLAVFLAVVDLLT